MKRLTLFKKMSALIMTAMMVLSLAACTDEKTAEADNSSASEETKESTEESTEGTDSAKEQEATEMNRELVVYFSATGNTKEVAETLSEMKEAEIIEIVPAEPYTDEDLNYNDSNSRTTIEQNDENARPEIAEEINLDEYSVIYVGYPNWWGDMPRILYTFFDTYDLSGKTIAPFCTSGGSGLSGTVETIAELEPEATVTEGMHASAANAESDIQEWLNEIGL